MTESEMRSLSDRDLLVMLHTKVDFINVDVASLKERVTTLEDRDNQQLGMVKLATFLSTVLKSLPIVALGAIAGKEIG